MTYSTIQTPIPVATPRGAFFFAWLLMKVSRWADAWTVAREQRSQRQRETALVKEANQLRAYAASVSRSDPSFAGDLFAAADRHEVEAR